MILRNARRLFRVIFRLIMLKTDEQSRLKARIAEFERRIAEAQGDADAGCSLVGATAQGQILDMLVRTLEALKRRRAVRTRTP